MLIGGRSQKIAHLGLEWVVHLHINVITGCLLLVVRIHAIGSTQEGKGEHTAVCIPPTRAKPAAALGLKPKANCLEEHSHPSSHLPNDMVDDNGVWMLQQPGQLHGNLRETESATTEDLESTKDAFEGTGGGGSSQGQCEECSSELAQWALEQ